MKSSTQGNRRHHLNYATLLLLLLAFIAVGGRAAHAATYFYSGPAWNTSQCTIHYTPATCINGSITGSVTFTGISSSYSGWVYLANVSAWTLQASDIGYLSSASNYMPYARWFVSNGEITAWQMQAYASSTSNPVITTIGLGTGTDYDTAAVGSPNITKSGWVQGVAYPGRWTSPKALGRPAQLPELTDWVPPDPTKTPDLCDPGCPSSPAQPLAQRGDPVDVATGNVFEQVLDYTTVGQNPLAFIRYYNSKTTMDTLATTLGVGWRHNYDRYLHIVSSTEVDAERSDGKVVTFNLVSTVWTPNADVDIKLTKSGSTYTLTDHDDTIETYTASGSVATLDSIAKPNGYTQTLSYSSGKLSSVTDSYSRSLSFTYTGSELTGVSTPDSATLTYAYATVASQRLLQSVAYNTSPSTSQTYTYTDVNYPFALTGITDENGNSYASWTYDTLGRCTDAQHAGSADDMQISYNTNGQRTVTGTAGRATDLHLHVIEWRAEAQLYRARCGITRYISHPEFYL